MDDPRENARRSRELIRRLERGSLMRPLDTSLGNINTLFALSFLKDRDRQRQLVIESDLAELSQGRPFQKAVCDGSFQPLKKSVERLLARLDQKLDWIDKEFDRAFRSDGTGVEVPIRYGTFAKNLDELKTRWRLEVMDAAAIFEDADKNEVLQVVKDGLKGRTLQHKTALENTLREPDAFRVHCLTALSSCHDAYARYAKSPPKGDHSLDAAGFPVTHGLVLRDGGTFLEVRGILPDSGASATGGRLAVGKRITKATVRGKTAMTFVGKTLMNFGQSGFAPNDEIELSLEGEKAPVVYRASMTIAPGAAVLSADQKVFGGTTRWISIPAFDKGHEKMASSNASHQVRSALLGPGSYDSVVLDLRSNPGGYVDEVMKIASLFTKDPKLEHVGMSLGSMVEPKSEEPLLSATRNKPVVVLMNGESASGSEMLAGLLKAAPNVMVVGDTSYGKGIAATRAPLKHNEEVWYTALEYYDACKRVIQGEGIRPDVPLSTAEAGNPRMRDQERVPRGTPHGGEISPPQDRERLMAEVRQDFDELLNFDPRFGALRLAAQKNAEHSRRLEAREATPAGHRIWASRLRDQHKTNESAGLLARTGANLRQGKFTLYDEAVMRLVAMFRSRLNGQKPSRE